MHLVQLVFLHKVRTVQQAVGGLVNTINAGLVGICAGQLAGQSGAAGEPKPCQSQDGYHYCQPAREPAHTGQTTSLLHDL